MFDIPMDKPFKAEPAASDPRKARLAEQLRANLQKRKVQARARRAGDEDQRAGLGENRQPARED